MTQAKCLFLFEVHLPSRYRCPAHRHPCTEIVLSNQSSGLLRHGSKCWPYGADSVLVYQPGADHLVENQRAGDHLCVGVMGCGAQAIPPGVWAASQRIRQIFDELRLAAKVSSGKDSRNTTTRLDLLAGLLAVELSETAHPARPVSRVQPYAQAAKQMIDLRFDQIASIQDVAACLFISPDYLRQLFKHEFGVAPIRYLITKRIEAACEMLGHSTTPIHAVAASSGFDNPFYFARIFKRIVGVTPSAYRAKHRPE